MRFSKRLFIIGYLCSLQAFALEYYRWVDENGTLHLSDTPPEYRDKTNSRVGINTQSFGSSTKTKTPSPSNAIAIPNHSYDMFEELSSLNIASSIQLISPQNDETIRNNQGNIVVQAKTNNPLAKDQFVRVWLDGKIHATKKNQTFTLKNIDRGSHSLLVQLIKNDTVITSTPPITVFLHRASLN